MVKYCVLYNYITFGGIVIADEELGCGGGSQESEGCSDCTGGILRIKDGVCSTGRGLLCSKVQQTGSSLAVVSHYTFHWMHPLIGCLLGFLLMCLLSSQILNGVARYAFVNAIASSYLEFEMSGVLYVGGLLLRRGEITVLQLWRYVCYPLQQNIARGHHYPPVTKTG